MTITVDSLGTGYGIGMIGQSNVSRWFSSGPNPGTTASANIRRHANQSWFGFAGAMEGAKIFGNALTTALSSPIGLIDYGVGSSSLFPVDDNYWAKGTDNYVEFVAACNAIGGCDCILWIQGEADAKQDYSLSYASRLSSLIIDLRADIPNTSGLAQIPFLIVSPGRSTDSAREFGTQRVREQQYSIAEQMAGVYIVDSMHDQNLTDNVHLDDYTTTAQRCAVAVETVLVGSPADGVYLSPYIRGISVVSATQTDVLINLSGATDFTPTSGIQGFKVFEVGGNEKTVSAAVRQSATVIRLTHASVTGDRRLTYADDIAANVPSGLTPTELSSMVRDNSTVPRALLSSTRFTTAAPGGVASVDGLTRSVTRAITK